jgi:stage II sporulation protein E
MKLKTKAIRYQGTKKVGQAIFSAPVSKRIAVQAVYFALGLLVSRAAVFGSYAPFGAALAAAAPFSSMIAVAGGAVIGHLLPMAAGESVRYLASIIAVAAVRWTLNDLKRVSTHPLFAPLVAFAPVLATGLAVNTVDGFAAAGVVMSVTESLLAGGAAYFFWITAKAAAAGKGVGAFSQQELACTALTVCIVVLAFAGVQAGPLSIGRVLAVLAILFCARYGNVVGGSVSGIAAGLVFSLSATGVGYLSGAYAFGGLMAGIFSPLGRLATAAAFILSNAVTSLQSGSSTAVITSLYEVAAATVIFALLPKNAGSRLSTVFGGAARDMAKADTQEVRRTVAMRLGFASRALADVGSAVEEVAQKLDKLDVATPNAVFEKTMESACRRCGLKRLCLEQEANETRAAFHTGLNCLESKGRLQAEDFPQRFAQRCSKLSEVVRCINQYYEEYEARQSAQRRVREVRSVISGQFAGTQGMLDDLSEALEQPERLDRQSAQRTMELLQKAGISPVAVYCRLDQRDRYLVDIEAVNGPLPEEKEISRLVSKACARMMELPCITSIPGRWRIQLSEKTLFSVQTGAAQHVCGGGLLCGDNYHCFPDGAGHMIAVLSDGMGTGGRAAVDGAMASGVLLKLLRAGFRYSPALQLVNSALMVKSGEESLATLDVTDIDLYSGRTTFFKAGAPLTLAKTKGRVIRVDAPSMPVGILTEVEFAKEELRLEAGDWILMVSDGAVANGDEWLETELQQWEGDAKQLARRIVEQSRERRTDGHDDDITAVALKLESQEYRG